MKAMIVAGMMSGTSADGVDVAMVKISPSSGYPKMKLLAHHSAGYPAALRRAVIASMNAPEISTAELARLNWRLGIAYAEALREAVDKSGVKPDLVGCHGQTIYHQGKPSLYAGRRMACTWQLGEPALIAAEMKIPVVSNFRPADMAAGGQGAPLVPLLDAVLFAHTKRGRVLQNIGGIGNLTVMPAGAKPGQFFAFDTGPGNMVIDQLMEKLYQKNFDRDGRVGRSGKVLDPVISTELRKPYYKEAPPKSAGREEYGAEFAASFLNACQKLSKKPEDAIATATALAAESIALAYSSFVQKKMTGPVDFIASGGGTRNRTLMQLLEQKLTPLGCSVSTIDDAGMPSQAKEAVAFALLAWQTWHHLPGNLPSATGAKRPAILGEVCYA
ncbi:anhydro-N-acetylmuramic acid kinase [Silvibacterium acidisoli]|uniref:anhydro-N-acetylmuramic acid kinase n=1 Tax=Acidobacteriaceae bacterium ZG23-2 TaxID=2883246 RepID=UPI00406C8B53